MIIFIDFPVFVWNSFLQEGCILLRLFVLGINVGNNTNHLTKREIEVLLLISEGAKNSTIAKNLFISPRTVEVHKSNIIKKLDLKSSNELTIFAGVNKNEFKNKGNPY